MVTHQPLPPSRAATVTLLGGELALDFANTESGRGHESHQDHLQAPGDVAAWLSHAKAIGPDESRWLSGWATARPAEGAKLLAEAHALRRDVHAIAASIARKAPPPSAAMTRLNAFHGHCLGCATLRPGGSAYHWGWDIERHPVHGALAPVAMSAIAILTGLDLARVKECGGAHCGWLFYDRSKNNTRRWCEMEICGNRAKQKRLRTRREAD